MWNRLIKICLIDVGVVVVVNKYHPAWQIIRVKARLEKDPALKLMSVQDWFDNNPSVQNYERVHNWIKMTAMGYRDETKEMFLRSLVELEAIKDQCKLVVEDDWMLGLYDTDDLRLVYKDLLKRKYGFQFKKVPLSHTLFMARLSEYLDESQ